MEQSLADKLQALTDSNKATPLWVFLYIYSVAERDSYVDYMEGAKTLHSYLTNKGTLPLDYQTNLYPEIDNPNFKENMRPHRVVGSIALNTKYKDSKRDVFFKALCHDKYSEKETEASDFIVRLVA